MVKCLFKKIPMINEEDVKNPIETLREQNLIRLILKEIQATRGDGIHAKTQKFYILLLG